jgi:hypothetical protein
MDLAKINDWMQIAGLFAVVASLIFVALQLQQDRSLAIVESTSSRADTISELTNMVADNRELWVSALDGDELSKADQAAFHAMVESVESYFFALSIRAQGNASDLISQTPDNTAATYAFALYSHEGLRRAWEHQMEFWVARDAALNMIDAGAAFRERVQARLDQLDDAAPQLPAQKRYVFW